MKMYKNEKYGNWQCIFVDYFLNQNLVWGVLKVLYKEREVQKCLGTADLEPNQEDKRQIKPELNQD